MEKHWFWFAQPTSYPLYIGCAEVKFRNWNANLMPLAAGCCVDRKWFGGGCNLLYQGEWAFECCRHFSTLHYQF